MGIITDYLRSMIARQVNDPGLVVWYDPEGHYRDVARDLRIPNTTISRYDGSFFALRHEIEPLMEGSEPPRLVVYVPLDPSETHNALVEVEAAGVTMKPGQQPPVRNTRLSIVARNALKPILGEDTTAAIEKQVEAGKLTLADLDALAEKGEGITKGVVSVIFGTSNPQEVALAFLASDRHDTDVVNKGAGAELALLLQATFGGSDKWQVTSDELRGLCQRFARHVLLTDFLSSIVVSDGSLPNRFSSLVTCHLSLVTATSGMRRLRPIGQNLAAEA